MIQKVKIFCAEDIGILEDEINRWLKEATPTIIRSNMNSFSGQTGDNFSFYALYETDKPELSAAAEMENAINHENIIASQDIITPDEHRGPNLS